MIGKDDGWKILVGIVPWYCKGGDDRKQLYWLKEGLPSIPRKGDWFYNPKEGVDFLAGVFGECPCGWCKCAEGYGCPHGSRGGTTEDFIVVHDVTYDVEAKEIVIVLREEEG